MDKLPQLSPASLSGLTWKQAEAAEQVLVELAALTPSALSGDAGEDIDTLRYLARMLECHADKFPVPGHIPPKVETLRRVIEDLQTRYNASSSALPSHQGAGDE